MLHHIPLQIVPHLSCVPAGLMEEPLNAIGRRLAQVFGKLPGITSRYRSQQATQVTTGSLPYFLPEEPRPDPPEESRKLGFSGLQHRRGRRIQRPKVRSFRHGSVLQSLFYPPSAAVVLGRVR